MFRKSRLSRTFQLASNKLQKAKAYYSYKYIPKIFQTNCDLLGFRVQNKSYTWSPYSEWLIILATLSAICCYKGDQETIVCESAKPLVYFKREEIAKHTTKETGIWIIYDNGNISCSHRWIFEFVYHTLL